MDKERTAVIVGAARTPIGRFLGGLAPLSATELGAVAIRAAVERSGVEPGEIEEVILGNVVSAGLGQAPARQAAMRAGLPETVEIGRASGRERAEPSGVGLDGLKQSNN